MTLDGFCDHTAIDPDAEIHEHYQELLQNSGVILYGSITYQLMKFWQDLVANPSGEQSMDNFATAIDNIPKIVFSHQLQDAAWASAKVSDQSLEAAVLELRQQAGKDILVGSRSLIIQLLELNLIDEFQLCVHPVIACSGLPLFEKMNNRTVLKLIKTKTFSSGAIIQYYEPANKTAL